VIDQRWERIKDLLHQAMQLTADRRGPFLKEACCADEPLRLEVESLLAADAAAPPSFLKVGPDEPESSGELAAGQLFEQRFRLIRKLGEGGMGQVWLAEQIAPVRRQVAVKLIRAGMYDSSVFQRFHSERQSLAMMDHPCIAKVFDAGTTAFGQPYFVMEYVPGIAITEYCDERKLKIDARLELFMRACDGVQHAHQKAIIHRDLKPANILVLEVDGTPTPRIIDFGLAKPTAPSEDATVYTQFGQFMGTPGYMSPEQADPAVRDIDTRTDVYSLGVILYVLLTGMQPFEAKRKQRPPLDVWLRRLREEDAPVLSSKLNADRDSAIMVAFARSTEPKQLVRRLRGDLDGIVSKALQRERELRYATPAELAADLKRHLNHEPISARPATVAYQVRKFIRRHRIAAAVAGAVAAAAIIASIAGLIAIKQEPEVAAQRLRDGDLPAARSIILEVLINPRFPRDRASAAIGVFQQVRAEDAELALLSGHTERVFDAEYSPDGTHIVTAAADMTARIWDVATGAELLRLSGHTDRIFAARYSPDGTRIVTASRDKTARVWDVKTGRTLLTLSGHADRIDSATYSPDGAQILTASWDHTARLWDARTGAEIRRLSGHVDVLYSAAFSPDGARIVTASQDKTARIWDARTGHTIKVLAGHGDYVTAAAFSPDGSRIVTASADRTARLWDARSGAPIAVLSGHGDVVYSVGFSPDGTRIVSGSWDKTARIWDAASGAALAVLRGHGATVAAAHYSPDGAHIVTASQDLTARIWDARVGAQLLILSGHEDPLYGAAFSKDGKSIVTASYDQSARIWDARTGQVLQVLLGHTGAVVSGAFSPDGSRVVTASQDGTLRVWDARAGNALGVLRGHLDRVYSAAYSPDGTRIVSASRDKTARIWDAQTGAVRRVLAAHADRVYTAAYSADGTRIVTASRDRTARIWDAESGSPLGVLAGHDDEVLTASYSPDGTRIVTASRDRTARIWDARTGAALLTLLGHPDVVDWAQYSPDGRHIVTACDDKIVRIWDASSGVELAALIGHTDVVSSASYAPDGAYIITASADKTARIWDARVPSDIASQIAWYAAAEPDSMPAAERARLGMAVEPIEKRRTGGSGDSDRLAAQRVHDALAEPDRSKQDEILLDAFSLYARAANDARLRNRTDELVQSRHRRATLARVLAQHGMMRQVADAYLAALAGRAQRAR
jgi:WD40 repeat protein